MLYDDLRSICEDTERLEQGIADRVLEDPKHLIRTRLRRDHEIANFISRIKTQSERAHHIYANEQEARTRELQAMTTGDTLESFFDQYQEIKQFHKRYPNEPVDNLERAYKRPDEGGPETGYAGDISSMFRAEEGFGRFLDLTLLHEEYLNLPGVRGVKKPNYLTYLTLFDAFAPPKCSITRKDKMTDAYFSYVRSLAEYLESFLQRVKPLENSEELYKNIDEEFQGLWDKNEVPGWESLPPRTNGGLEEKPFTEGTGAGIWCADCKKEFSNDNTYKSHLSGKKHIKNAETRERAGNSNMSAGAEESSTVSPIARLQERAVAEREHRIRNFADMLKGEREDTRVNVERKAGMTEKERQQEIAALYAEELDEAATYVQDNEEQDGEEKLYNPLKLPLAWDGKPIPFWLYKLHGLGVEFPCEICGNYVYMGRRAFDKHFSEQRHIYNLNCLGINKNTSLFREITKIDEALKLWEKLKRDQQEELEKKGGQTGQGVIEMEDSMGNVMPKNVYDDLATAGLL